ncbi:MAG: acyltransferase [Alistipes sp.]|nr:acyltransferase [Alistipes sp.]
MLSIGEILAVNDPGRFERAALDLFRFQAEMCEPYRKYIRLTGIDPSRVDSTGKIPFLPIELFKTSEIYCGDSPPEVTFTSSTTGGGTASKHRMAFLSDYEKTFLKAFTLFYGDPAGYSIYALLPGYLEREGSSLVYMVDRLVKRARAGGFYLYDTEKLLGDIARDEGKKILLGVTYSLLDLAEKGPDLSGAVVMETGGMKGRREELTKKELHERLCNAFSVEAIHSEYGMAEMSSQAYSQGRGIFRSPPWMKVMVRDLNDPFDIRFSGSGGLNVIDLANRYSCTFIQTGDIGNVYPDGAFTVSDRADRSEIRGCNLLVQ